MTSENEIKEKSATKQKLDISKKAIHITEIDKDIINYDFVPLMFPEEAKKLLQTKINEIQKEKLTENEKRIKLEEFFQKNQNILKSLFEILKELKNRFSKELDDANINCILKSEDCTKYFKELILKKYHYLAKRNIDSMLQPFIDEFLSNLDKTYEAHIKHLPKQVSTQKVGGENGNIDKKKSGFEKQDPVHEINEIFAPNSYDLIDDAEKPYDNKPKEVEKIKYISFKNPNAFFKNWDDQCLELLKLVWSGKIVPFDPVIYDPGHYDKLMQLIINLVKNSQPMFANEVTQKLFIETVHMFIKSLPESIQAKEKSEDIDNSLNYKTNSKEREVNSN